MKVNTIIAAVSLAALPCAYAQTFVLESPVFVSSTISTQGEDVTRTRGSTTVNVKSIEKRRFNNEQIIKSMIKRKLLKGSAEDWKLTYLMDETGGGGIYAQNPEATPVAVPADLITLPAFGPTITTGRETTGPKGTNFVGTTEISAATLSVDGIPASGLSTNGIRTITLTIDGITYQLDTVRTTMSFTGGLEGESSDSILRGVITIGDAKLSTIETLP